MTLQDPSPITRSTETYRSSPITPKLVFGLLLIFVGIVFTLDQMDWLDAGDVLRFWPLILVAAGASKLFWPGSAGSRFSGLLLIFIGGWLQLEILDVVYHSIWDFWPLLLVLLGIRLVWRGLFGGRRRVASDSASTVNAVAVMGGVNRVSTSPDFRGGDMIAFMGGCEADLRQAKIAAGPAVIDAFAFWGGVEIRVPEDWTVIIQGFPFLGGYEDSTRQRAADYGQVRQELVVKGFAIMGGVEVKN